MQTTHTQKTSEREMSVALARFDTQFEIALDRFLERAVALIEKWIVNPLLGPDGAQR